MLQKSEKLTPGIEQKLTPESEGLLGFRSGLHAGRIGFDLRLCARRRRQRRAGDPLTDPSMPSDTQWKLRAGREGRRAIGGVGCARAGWGGVRAVLTTDRCDSHYQ